MVVDDPEVVAAVGEQPTVTSESLAEVPGLDSVVVDMAVLQLQPTAVVLEDPLLLLLMEAAQHTVVPVVMAEAATVIHQAAADNPGGRLLHVDASLFRFPFFLTRDSILRSGTKSSTDILRPYLRKQPHFLRLRFSLICSSTAIFSSGSSFFGTNFRFSGGGT